VRVEWSTVNYKTGLRAPARGRGCAYFHYPPASIRGTVESSAQSAVSPGEPGPPHRLARGRRPISAATPRRRGSRAIAGGAARAQQRTRGRWRRHRRFTAMLAVMAAERHWCPAATRSGDRDRPRRRLSRFRGDASLPKLVFTSSPQPAARARRNYLRPGRAGRSHRSQVLAGRRGPSARSVGPRHHSVVSPRSPTFSP